MASRPAEGELSVRRTGILHGAPSIEPQWNPRNASIAVACALRERVIENFLSTVRQKAGLD